MNAYYSHNVLGKRKYLSLRKANRQSTFENMQIVNFVSYKNFSKQINNVDIGELIDISTLSTNSQQQVCGSCHPPSTFILRMAKFYLEVNQKREDKLKSFPSFNTKDSDSFLFAMAIGSYGAPGTGMAILVSFLNVSERLPSSKEQFLLFGGAVEENSEIVSNLFKILIKDVRFLESNISEIATRSGIQEVEFELAELPNNMKMVAFLAGELSNVSTYFCTFANVRRNELILPKQSHYI